MGRSRIPGVVVVAIALALVAGACSSTSEEDALEEALDAIADSSTSSSSTTSTSSSTTTTSTTTVPVTEPEPDPTEFPEPSDGEVFDAYIASQLEGWAAAMRKATEDPSATPEVDHPEMARYAAESYLDINLELVSGFVEKNWVAQEPLESAAGRTVGEKNRISPVKRTEGDTVDVFRCVVEDEDIVNSESGEIEIQGVVTVLMVVTMKRFVDGWKAVFSEVSQKIEGVAGCFLANDIEFPY